MLTQNVIASIKRSFSRSQTAKKFKNKAIVQGETGIRGGKIGKCNICGEHFPLYKLQIDHIDPATPVMIPAKYMSFIMLFKRVFCKESNLQVICPECHDKKSKAELKQRVYWRKHKKFIVCRKVWGCSIKTIPISNMKDFDENWEIMGVFKTRREADSFAKKLRKM